MTIEEVQATLAERENEIAALVQTEKDCVEQVRKFADGRRNAASQRTAIELATKPLRDALAVHMAEQRKLAIEKAKADAEAKAKEPKPPSEVEQLKAQIAELTELVKAKG